MSFSASTNDRHEADTQIDSHMMMELPEVLSLWTEGDLVWDDVVFYVYA